MVRRRATRKKSQKGGYFPSIYGGISNASMLIPLVARQAYRMYDNRKSRKRRKSGAHFRKTRRTHR